MKKSIVLLISLTVVAAWALSCAAGDVITPKQPDTEYTATVSASPDEVYAAFVKYFADNGYTLETADKSMGIIVTDKKEITDKDIIPFYKDVTGDKSEYKVKGVNLGYCDCGMPDMGWKKFWRSLFCSYTVGIKKADGNKTQFKVKAKFWTQRFQEKAFAVLEYEGDWDCVSTGQYETKLIEDIKTKYLK
jgi:hypothetical protein